MALKKAKNVDWQDVYACPAEGEMYYLHVLLNHVRRATSFDNLKTIGTALNSVHDFLTQYIFMCVVVCHKNSLCSLSGYIFLYIVCFWTWFDMFHLFCRYHN
jgi:hypothetical protein